MAAPRPDAELDELGVMLRTARRLHDLTQDALAAQVGVVQSEVSAIESGTRVKVPLDNLVALARVLRLDQGALFKAAAARLERDTKSQDPSSAEPAATT